MYRVQGALGQERSLRAVISRQVGPLAEPEPTETPTTESGASAGPPTAILCFYQSEGEVRSMALETCSVEALVEAWESPQ